MIAQIKGAGERLYLNIAKAVILVMAVIACTATTVAAASNMVVSYVYCDDEMVKVVSFSSDVDDILSRADIKLNENDIVDVSYYTEGENDGVIYVYRAAEVTVKDGEKNIYVKTAGTVKDALKKAGVTLGKGDKLNYSEDLYIFDGMKINVTRAFSVKVVADSKTKTCMVTNGQTVSDALKSAGVVLGKNDTVNKKLTKKLKKDMKIVVERVVYKNRNKTESVGYKTVTKKDASMYTNQTKVKQQGKTGKKTVTYRDKYVNGKLVQSQAVKTKIKIKPKNKIVLVGTKTRPATSVKGRAAISELTPPSSLKLDKNGRPTNYKKVITGKATAYSCGTLCSTGVHVKPGYVAVNPRQIPYGTKLYIVSSDGKYNYGYAIAADTGGFVYNGSGVIVDLFMWSERDCVNFGKRNVDIYVLG